MLGMLVFILQLNYIYLSVEFIIENVLVEKGQVPT